MEINRVIVKKFLGAVSEMCVCLVVCVGMWLVVCVGMFGVFGVLWVRVFGKQ